MSTKENRERKGGERARGRLLAATLEGAWRQNPPAPAVSVSELERIAPLLVGSGAAPLSWWKLQATALASSRPAQHLREVYRFQTLQSALQERAIEKAFRRLDEAGVEAVLVKGWTAARDYPEAGLRPFGDIDICVRPGHGAAALRALDDPAGRDFWVDLHEGFDKADERDFDELYARTEAAHVGATALRVLCREDHLRLLCVHLLRHGAWRPLWLCDVAAALERRSARFDWSLLFGEQKRRARWVACAIRLAHQLVGARLAGTPLENEAERLPRWLVPEVLKQWETPFPTHQAPMRHRAPMRKYLREPAGVVQDLFNRWPNPIEATIGIGGAFNEWPRAPFQLGYAAARTVRFLSRLPKTARAGA